MGAVFHIAAPRFARLSLVDAATGTYSIEANTTPRRVHALAPVGTHSVLQVFERARRVLTVGRNFSGDLISELGRHDGAGRCGVL